MEVGEEGAGYNLASFEYFSVHKTSIEATTFF